MEVFVMNENGNALSSFTCRTEEQLCMWLGANTRVYVVTDEYMGQQNVFL